MVRVYNKDCGWEECKCWKRRVAFPASTGHCVNLGWISCRGKTDWVRKKEEEEVQGIRMQSSQPRRSWRTGVSGSCFTILGRKDTGSLRWFCWNRNAFSSISVDWFPGFSLDKQDLFEEQGCWFGWLLLVRQNSTWRQVHSFQEHLSPETPFRSVLDLVEWHVYAVLRGFQMLR